MSIICPHCDEENPPGDSKYCEHCGEELAEAASGSGESTSGSEASSGEEWTCPQCQNSWPEDYGACETCGHVRAEASKPEEDDTETIPAVTPAAEEERVSEVAEEAVPEPEPEPEKDEATTVEAHEEPPPAPAATGADLQQGSAKLVVEQGMTIGKQFLLNDPEMLVGREDADEDIFPDIDLSDQDDGYVHRRHATLKFEGGKLLVVDLGGSNKTYLNNRPIAPQEPQELSVGDKIRFGKVVLRLLQA